MARSHRGGWARPLLTGSITLAAFIGFVWTDQIARSAGPSPGASVGFAVYMTPATESQLAAAKAGSWQHTTAPEWTVSLVLDRAIDDSWAELPADTSMAMVSFGSAVQLTDDGPVWFPPTVAVSLSEGLDFFVYVYGNSAPAEPRGPHTVTTYELIGIGPETCASYEGSEGWVEVKYELLASGGGSWPDRYWCHIPPMEGDAEVRIAMWMTVTSPMFDRDTGGRSTQQYVYPEGVVTLMEDAQSAIPMLEAASEPAPIVLRVTPRQGVSFGSSPSPVLRADSGTLAWQLKPSSSVVFTSVEEATTLLFMALSQLLLLASGVGLGLLPGQVTTERSLKLGRNYR